MVRNLLSVLVVILLASSCKQEKVSQNEVESQDSIATDSLEIVKLADSLKNAGYSVFTYEEDGERYLMQEYYMVQLLTGSNDSLPKEEIARLQAEHLKHLSRMYKEGHASLIGPMNNGGEWRGIVVFNTPTLEMADSLANLDPFVKSGVLKVKTTGWWTAKEGKLR